MILRLKVCIQLLPGVTAGDYSCLDYLMKLFLTDTAALELKAWPSWKTSVEALEEAAVRLAAAGVPGSTFPALAVLHLAAFLWKFCSFPPEMQKEDGE